MRHKVEFNNGAFHIHLQGELNHLVAIGEVSIDEPNFKEAFDKKLKELIMIFLHVHDVFFERQLQDARESIKRQTDECYAMMTLKKEIGGD